MSEVVIVIPIYKNILSKYERISLFQCLKILNKHPVSFVMPNGFDNSFYVEACNKFQKDNISFIEFDEKYFAGLRGYNRLMMLREFYTKFSSFDYMLIYQLDCFVFRDDLLFWCNKGYSYIGAPWFEGSFHNPNKEAKFNGVGNGGLSLRNIQDTIDVLNSSKKVKKIKEYYTEWKAQKNYMKLPFLAYYLRSYLFRNKYDSDKNDFNLNEDFFYCLYASKVHDFFTLPEPKEAVSFSFELLPKRLYEMNNFQLPFGCHAWWKHDFEFWKEIMGKEGVIVD